MGFEPTFSFPLRCSLFVAKAGTGRFAETSGPDPQSTNRSDSLANCSYPSRFDFHAEEWSIDLHTHRVPAVFKTEPQATAVTLPFWSLCRTRTHIDPSEADSVIHYTNRPNKKPPLSGGGWHNNIVISPSEGSYWRATRWVKHFHYTYIFIFYSLFLQIY